MKYLIIATLFLIFSPNYTICQFSKAKLDSIISGKITYWNYLENIDVSNAKKFYNLQNELVTKEAFLSLIKTGDFLPYNLENNSRMLGLINLETTKNSNRINTIKEPLISFAAIEFSHYLSENKAFPEFNFTDLNDYVFTNSNLKGKKILLKCWFINCTACIAEFPEVNKIVEKYKDRNDIEYLSLAFEDNEKLKNFLVERPLNYKVIGNQRSFIENTLKLNAMPTHYLIDENGKIVKVVNNVNSLKTSIKDLLGY